MDNASENTGTPFSQFQTRRLPFLLIPVIALTFSGCFDDFDFNIDPASVDLTEEFHWGIPTVPEARMKIWIDSATQKNDSTIRFLVKLHYDSVVIRSAYGISYAKTGDTLALIKIFSAKADTLDFRKLPDMNYSYDLDFAMNGLETKVNYTVCPFMDYAVKGDTIRISGSSFGGRCFSFETE